MAIDQQQQRFLEAFPSLRTARTHCERAYVSALRGGEGRTAMAATAAAAVKKRVLLLGFYFRGNLGDEAYRHIMAYVFNGCLGLTFCSMDDVGVQGVDGFDVVVCGGGDILNEYFIGQLSLALSRCSRRPCCFAFSVGIPYPATAGEVLRPFDHVFVRSQSCFEVAANVLGAENVTYMPDLAFALGPAPDWTAMTRPVGVQVVSRYRLGVCLAQPVFRRAAPALLEKVTRCVFDTARALRAKEIRLIAFNTFVPNADESDVELNAAVAARLRVLYQTLAAREEREAVAITEETSEEVAAVRRSMSEMNALICMRYHSVVFSLLEAKPFFALYTTQKVENLMSDVQRKCSLLHGHGDAAEDDAPSWGRHRLVADGRGVPIAEELDAGVLSKNIIAHFVRNRACPFKLFDTREVEAGLGTFMAAVALKKRKVVLRAPISDPPPSSSAERLLLSEPFLAESPDTVARALCYVATGALTSAYSWGLREKIARARELAMPSVAFREFLVQQCAFVRDDFAARARASARRTTSVARSLAPAVTFFDDVLAECSQALPDVLQVAVDLDYIGQAEFEGVHRSGWAYVVSGLRLLDANLYGGECCDGRQSIVLDTYVDRTFHWGAATLELCGKIPYVTAWAGFVHHTYDVTHSDYNCVSLFQKAAFLSSLTHCKCLFALSEDLAAKLRASLLAVGHGSVPVRVLTHPTEFTDLTFSMPAFMTSRPARCIAHVGAWLRRPYALFELDIDAARVIDGVPMSKVFVRGLGMGAYLPPDDSYVQQVEQALGGTDPTLRRMSMCRGSNEGSFTAMCRDATTTSTANLQTSNKFVQGMASMLQKHKDSVTIIDMLDNYAFDALLAKSIVFIDLVDASAVNTVIECIVRNTPIFVNRLPALEEILGVTYPGFYSSTRDAEIAMSSLTHIAMTHDYLKRLDKTPFKLATFVARFHDILLEVLA